MKNINFDCTSTTDASFQRNFAEYFSENEERYIGTTLFSKFEDVEPFILKIIERPLKNNIAINFTLEAYNKPKNIFTAPNFYQIRLNYEGTSRNIFQDKHNVLYDEIIFRFASKATNEEDYFLDIDSCFKKAFKFFELNSKNIFKFKIKQTRNSLLFVDNPGNIPYARFRIENSKSFFEFLEDLEEENTNRSYELITTPRCPFKYNNQANCAFLKAGISNFDSSESGYMVIPARVSFFIGPRTKDRIKKFFLEKYPESLARKKVFKFFNEQLTDSDILKFQIEN